MAAVKNPLGDLFGDAARKRLEPVSGQIPGKHARASHDPAPTDDQRRRAAEADAAANPGTSFGGGIQGDAPAPSGKGAMNEAVRRAVHGG